MKNFFLLPLTFLSILFFCKKNEVNTQDIKIKKKSLITIVFNKPQIVDTIWYNAKSYTIIEDPIYYREEGNFINENIALKKNITDTIKINTDKPIYLSHSYGLNYTNTYMFHPGDLIVFEYEKNIPFLKNRENSKNYDFTSIFNEKNPINQDAMSFFQKNNRYKNKSDLKKDSIEWVNRDKKQLIFLDSIKGLNQISEDEFNLYSLTIRNKMELVKNNPTTILNKKHNLSIPANTSLIKKSFEKLNKPLLFKTTNGRNVDFLGQFKKVLVAENIFEENKRFLLFTYLESIARNYSKEEFIKNFDLFKNKTGNESEINYFKEKYPKLFNNYTLEKSNIKLINSLKKEVTLKDILKVNKGKVIYVDFWASWCAPCRVLLPESHKLKEEYVNKDVQFIYVSIDEDIQRWISAYKKEQIIENSYLATDYPHALFYKEFDLKTIPRYMLYDRTGKLVSSNAPNPEGKEIRNELNKYLKE